LYFVCFFHSCLLCDWPLGCWVSMQIRIELNYYYYCTITIIICLRITEVQILSTLNLSDITFRTLAMLLAYKQCVMQNVQVSLWFISIANIICRVLVVLTAKHKRCFLLVILHTRSTASEKTCLLFKNVEELCNTFRRKRLDLSSIYRLRFP
jgi:hypothetical protein